MGAKQIQLHDFCYLQAPEFTLNVPPAKQEKKAAANAYEMLRGM